MRIVSWNADGLSRLLAPAQAKPEVADPALPPHSLRELHIRLGSPEILCLQEIRVRSSDAALISKLEDALPGYQCAHSLCRDAVNVRFRGGRAYGVATYVAEGLEPRWLERPSWDLEGRVVTVELPSIGLFVANVYAINGTPKRYWNHELGRFSGDRHALKVEFQRHMQRFFRGARDRGLRLLLIGDWNVSRSAIDTHPRLRTEAPHTQARAHFNDVFMPELEVCDIYRELHPDQRSYTWFNRVAARYGRLDAARVDYALVSRSLAPNVQAAEVMQEHAFSLGSDHAPISIELAS